MERDTRIVIRAMMNAIEKDTVVKNFFDGILMSGATFAGMAKGMDDVGIEALPTLRAIQALEAALQESIIQDQRDHQTAAMEKDVVIESQEELLVEQPEEQSTNDTDLGDEAIESDVETKEPIEEEISKDRPDKASEEKTD